MQRAPRGSRQCSIGGRIGVTATPNIESVSDPGIARRFGYVGDPGGGECRLVLEAFAAAGWERVFGPGWELLWYLSHDPPPQVLSELGPHQKLNHFPGIVELCDKLSMFRHLAAMRERMRGRVTDEELAFFPQTYGMPEDAEALRHHMTSHPERLWVCKPKSGAWGRDVRIVSVPEEIPAGSAWLVQEYIGPPLLYRDRKFNLRVFVLILSFDPLVIYAYRDGYVDLAGEPWRDGREYLDHVYMHNTNSGVQSTRPGFDAAKQSVDIRTWRSELHRNGIDDQTLWAAVQDMIVKLVVSAEHAIVPIVQAQIPHPGNCFELLGLDITFDRQLRPWIIECNRSPSMTPDYLPQIKRRMLYDLFDLLGLSPGTSEAATPPQNEVGRTTTVGDHDLTTWQIRYPASTGGFERIFPTPDRARYLDYFHTPRRSDRAIADQLACRAGAKQHTPAD